MSYEDFRRTMSEFYKGIGKEQYFSRVSEFELRKAYEIVHKKLVGHYEKFPALLIEKYKRDRSFYLNDLIADKEETRNPLIAERLLRVITSQGYHLEGSSKEEHQRRKRAIADTLIASNDFEALTLFRRIHDNGVGDSLVRYTRDEYNEGNLSRFIDKVYKAEVESGSWHPALLETKKKIDALPPGGDIFLIGSTEIIEDQKSLPPAGYIKSQGECEKVNGRKLTDIYRGFKKSS